MNGTFDIETAKAATAEPAASPELKPGDTGYVAPELKLGDEGYVLKEGDAGYVAPAAELKLGDEGYVHKEGDPGYKAPKAEPKPGDADYVPPVDEATAKATAEILKNLGVTSLDELKDKLKAPDSPEQLAEKAKEHELAVDQYAISSKKMTLEDVAALKNMKTVAPELLTKGVFEKSYLATHKDATKEEVDQQFRLFYHLDSTDEKLKLAGEQRVKTEAEQLVAAQQSKYDEAKKELEGQSAERAKMPAFRAAVQTALKGAVPEKLVLHTPEGKDPVTMPLTEADRKEVEQYLVKNGWGSTPEQLTDMATGYLKLKYDAEKTKAVYEAGLSAGRLEGSAVGAKVPFEVGKVDAGAAVVEDDLKKSDEKAKGLFGGGY